MPKRMCACTLSVWQASVTVSSSGRAYHRSAPASALASCLHNQRTSTRSMPKVGPLPERHSIGHETTHSRIAHSPSVYLETLYRSIEAVFHPSGRVILSLSSRTIERTCVHPYAHGNADTWTHVLIPLCIIRVRVHDIACIEMSMRCMERR